MVHIHTCRCSSSRHITLHGSAPSVCMRMRGKESLRVRKKRNWLRYRTLRKIFMMSNYCNFRFIFFLAPKMWNCFFLFCFILCAAIFAFLVSIFVFFGWLALCYRCATECTVPFSSGGYYSARFSMVNGGSERVNL